jgi:hypothetical protein
MFTRCGGHLFSPGEPGPVIPARVAAAREESRIRLRRFYQFLSAEEVDAVRFGS